LPYIFIFVNYVVERSGGKRRFFAPDEEKRTAFLRAQKNVAEQNATKGRSPDWHFA